MERPNITDSHYEAIGRMIIALPDRNDEVKCLQVKELFNDEDIFDWFDGEWYFHAKVFLDKYRTIEEAHYFAEQIKEISNPSGTLPITISENSEVKSIALAENTGGSVFNDIITLKNNHVIVVSSDGIFIFKDYKHYDYGVVLKSYIFE